MLSGSRFVAGLPMTGNVLENLERQTAWRRFARWCGYAVVVIVIMGFLPSPSHARAIAPANPSTAMGHLARKVCEVEGMLGAGGCQGVARQRPQEISLTMQSGQVVSNKPPRSWSVSLSLLQDKNKKATERPLFYILLA